MRKYAIKLDEYNIGKNRYFELAAFCKQYADKKNSGRPGDARDVQLIEETAKETDKLNAAAILRNVTEGVPYEHLQTYCGRRQFYELRRKYFWLLSQQKSG